MNVPLRARSSATSTAARGLPWLAALIVGLPMLATEARADLVDIVGGFRSYTGPVEVPVADQYYQRFQSTFVTENRTVTPGITAPIPGCDACAINGFGLGAAYFDGGGTPRARRVDFYNDSAIDPPPRNAIEFTPVTGVDLQAGDHFKLGTFTFTNGGWFGDFPDGMFEFHLQTVSANPALDGFDFNVSIGFHVTTGLSPDGTVYSTSPIDNADYFYIADHPEFGYVGVYEADILPPGGSNTGSIDLYGVIGSLYPTGFASAQGVTLQTTIPVPQVPQVPEPASTALMLAGLASVWAWARRARAARAARQRFKLSELTFLRLFAVMLCGTAILPAQAQTWTQSTPFSAVVTGSESVASGWAAAAFNKLPADQGKLHSVTVTWDFDITADGRGNGYATTRATGALRVNGAAYQDTLSAEQFGFVMVPRIIAGCGPNFCTECPLMVGSSNSIFVCEWQFLDALTTRHVTASRTFEDGSGSEWLSAFSGNGPVQLLWDAALESFYNTGPAGISGTVSSTYVYVVTVPEPATAWLMAAGFALALSRTRRQRL